MEALRTSAAGEKPADFDSRWADGQRVKREEPTGYTEILQKHVFVQLNESTGDLPVVGSNAPVVSEAVTTGQSYCVVCKTATYTRNSNIVRTSNGRQRIVGKCAGCKRNKSSFIKM